MELDYTDKARDEMLRATPPGKSTSLSHLEELRLEAIHSVILRDFAGAVSKYEEILKQVSDADRADACLDLGLTYQKSAKPKDAIRNFEEAALRRPEYAAAFL